jgi:hypothetical protein
MKENIFIGKANKIGQKLLFSIVYLCVILLTNVGFCRSLDTLNTFDIVMYVNAKVNVHFHSNLFKMAWGGVGAGGRNAYLSSNCLSALFHSLSLMQNDLN